MCQVPPCAYNEEVSVPPHACRVMDPRTVPNPSLPPSVGFVAAVRSPAMYCESLMNPGECQLPPYPLTASVYVLPLSPNQTLLVIRWPIASLLLSRQPEARCRSAANIQPPPASSLPVSTWTRASPHEPTRALHSVPRLLGTVITFI